MYSFSKMPISAQAIHDIVTLHFGSRSTLSAYHELKDGYFNAAYMIELMMGRNVSSRLRRQIRYTCSITKRTLCALRLSDATGEAANTGARARNHLL